MSMGKAQQSLADGRIESRTRARRCVAPNEREYVQNVKRWMGRKHGFELEGQMQVLIVRMEVRIAVTGESAGIQSDHRRTG
jgi:hypothetical protein